ENNLKIQQSSLDLALYRVQAGLSDGLDEEQARLSIETTKSQIPTLKAGIAQTRFTLAALLGLQPEAFSKKTQELLAAKTRPRLPDRLVIDTPADAIRRRPDIRRAERKLAAETARIGVRKSDLYPKLTLPGTLSYTTTGSTDTSIASIGLRLSWNIFDAGAIRRRVDIQKATQSEAFHAYEQTLFTALSEINGALVAYTQEEERRLALGRAAAHAEKAAMLTRLKYQTGLVAFSDVLTAEQTMLSRQNELAVSEGESISNFIRLYRVLGGGWQSYAPEEAREKPE
ncbi:partial Outer membrane protein OprM, partial [Anaerolineae bacterium]